MASISHNRRRFRIKPGMVFSYLALIVLGVVMAFPFVWMQLSSFKSLREIFRFNFWPNVWTLANYQDVLVNTQFPRWFLNSMVVAGISTVSVLFFCSLVGYTLDRIFNPRLRKI